MTLTQIFSVIPSSNNERATYSCEAICKAHVEEYFNDIQQENLPHMKITLIYNELENHMDIDEFYGLYCDPEFSALEAIEKEGAPIPLS